MQLEPYVSGVEEQFAAAASLGDDRVREVAAALAGALLKNRGIGENILTHEDAR